MTPNLPLSEQLTAIQQGSTFSQPVGLGLIRVQGSDAANFLHNQLSNAVEDLKGDEVRMAGYCSVKGRLMASMLYWRTGEAKTETDAITLLVSQDLLAGLQKRLTMFVMRAKAKLSDDSAAVQMIGLTGAQAATVLGAWFPQLPQAHGVVHSATAGSLLRMTDVAGQDRYLWLAPVEVASAALAQLATTLTPVSANAWQWLEVQSAIPRIVLATQDQFVPQMINFEALGGVNFKKGCYPGQEIVARSQYRGTIKRRLQLVTIEATTAVPAQEIFHIADASQPCGMVVMAAPTQLGQVLQIECKLEALNAGTLHLGTIDGPVLHLQPLPYDLPAEQ